MAVVVEYPTRSDCTYQSLLAFIRLAIIVYFAFCCVEIWGVYFCVCVIEREQIEQSLVLNEAVSWEGRFIKSLVCFLFLSLFHCVLCPATIHPSLFSSLLGAQLISFGEINGLSKTSWSNSLISLSQTCLFSGSNVMSGCKRPQGCPTFWIYLLWRWCSECSSTWGVGGWGIKV